MRPQHLLADWGRRHPGWLIGLVAYSLITLVTVGGLAIALQGNARARQTADEESEALAVAAAADADRYLQARLQVLGAVAQSEVLRSGDAQRIQAYLERLPSVVGFPELAWVDRDGVLRAYSAGLPAGPPVNYLDRSIFREALTTLQPRVGTVVSGRLMPSPTIPVVYPTFDPEGRLTGAVSTGIRLESRLGNQLHFGSVPGLRVIDSAGNLVIDGGPVEQLVDVSPWLANARLQGASGVTHGPGPRGGADHVIGFATVERGGWLVLVDRPAEDVYGTADQALRFEFAGIIVFAVLAAAGVAVLMRWLEHDAARVRIAEQAVEEGRRVRDELIATLGHDLGNPLTIIRGHAGLLRRQLGAENTSPTEIEQSARRMQRMIQGLMDLSTSENAVELSRDEVDLVPLARVLLEERQLLERSREFVLEADAEHIIGEWDRMRVERVIDNLLSNAVKYSPPESLVTLRVARQREDTGEWAVVEVLDRGFGIPEADRHRVFEAFFRGSNTGGQSGSGLGLSSVRRVVEQHGGSVAIAGRDGGGTCVRVRLPLAPSPQEGADAELEESATGAS